MPADVIRRARLRKGFTQEEAAEKAGVSLRTYQRLEQGKRDIMDASMRTGLGVCAALGIDPLTLFLDEERQAEIVETDFSDSAKIVGEFNVNEEDILEITDRELKALNLSAVHETIDNPYAWEILTAILTEKTE